MTVAQLQQRLRCQDGKPPEPAERCFNLHLDEPLSPAEFDAAKGYEKFLAEHPDLIISVKGQVTESSLNSAPPCALRLPSAAVEKGCPEPSVQFRLRGENDGDGSMIIGDWVESVSVAFAAYLWNETVAWNEEDSELKTAFFDAQSQRYIEGLPFDGARVEVVYVVSEEGELELDWIQVREEGASPWTAPKPPPSMDAIWPIEAWARFLVEARGMCPGGALEVGETRPWRYPEGDGEIISMLCTLSAPAESTYSGHDGYSDVQRQFFSVLRRPSRRGIAMNSGCQDSEGFESSWSCGVDERKVSLADGSNLLLIKNAGCSDAGCAAELETFEPTFRDDVPDKLTPPDGRDFVNFEFVGEAPDLRIAAEVTCTQSEGRNYPGPDCSKTRSYRIEVRGGLRLVPLR